MTAQPEPADPMLRSARTIARLLRAVSFACATNVLGALALGVAGCRDENAPETWVAKLGAPSERTAAVKRLLQFAGDAGARPKENPNDAAPNALLRKLIGPLTKAYLDGDLDEPTRVELIEFLSNPQFTEAKPAWIRACVAFAEGKGASEDDVKWAAGAIGATKLEEGATALGQAFVKLEAGTRKGALTYKTVHDAMLALSSPGWKPMILERLGRRMVKPSGAGDEASVIAFQNELFWQATAAELAGEIRDLAAVKPLFKIIMTRGKSDVAPAASAALVKIGKEGMSVPLDALAGDDPELIEYARSNSGGNADEAKSYIRAAALVLGDIGRGDATAPMLRALESADSETVVAAIARQLTRLPPKPELVTAFQVAYERVSLSTTLPPSGQNARSQLAEAAADFHDPSIVPWLLKQAKNTNGSDKERAMVRMAALTSAIKLMKKSQASAVEAAIKKEAGELGELEKVTFEAARGVVDGCGEDVDCYLSRLVKAAGEEDDNRLIGIKAAHMLAIFGNATTSMEIVKRLPRVKNAAVRYAAAQAIDHLTQDEPAPIADAVQKIVDVTGTKDEKNIVQANAPLKELVRRLRAR